MDRAEQERLYDAILGELADRGYERLVLADALARAGVSRADFDAEFDDADACLFAAYDALTARLTEKANAAARECGGDWPLRVRASLGTLLRELAAEPVMAEVLTRSFPAIRPAANLRYMEFLETFTRCLRHGHELTPAAGEPPREVEMLAIDSVEVIVSTEVEAGRAAQLPEMEDTIVFSLLAPFLGARRALEAQR